MSTENYSSEQRGHIRHQLKKNIFVAIQGDYFKDLGRVVDFNKKGVGVYAVCGSRASSGKCIILDLISDREQVILRSLSARVVFTSATGPNSRETTEEPSRRCGLKFVHLSALQKRQLDIITKKYARSEPGDTVSF